jgi:hypothetical protein
MFLQFPVVVGQVVPCGGEHVAESPLGASLVVPVSCALASLFVLAASVPASVAGVELLQPKMKTNNADFVMAQAPSSR